MDANNITQALRATTVAENQEKAAEYLKECSNAAGFSRLLLEISTSTDIECGVRQAAVIYLKNQIDKSWTVNAEDEKDLPTKTTPMAEQDKEVIKQTIIAAIVHSPEPIRVHLCTSIHYIMRNDFPSQWPGLVEEFVRLLHSNDADAIYGVLLVIHRLCKIYEYKRNKEKAPLVACMRLILPLLLERFTSLLNETAATACLLQKIILKIFYCLVQFSLHMEMITVAEMDHWIRIIMGVVVRPIPQECLDLKDNDQMEASVWWKCKKWALKTVARVFERYGSRGQVEETYADFAEHFSREFAVPIVESIMKSVLSDYVHGAFVSERVLYIAVEHFAESITQAQVWIAVKPHWQELLKSVVFPLLMYSDDDESMWDSDAEEFITSKYDAYEATIKELHNPSSAAGQLLQAMSRRSGVLQPTLEFILSYLHSTTATIKEVDSALNMIAALDYTHIHG